MDPEELRAHLRQAADALPGSPPGARAAVAQRVRRQRLTVSLTITAVVLAVVAAGAIVSDALRGERSIQFIDTPAASPNSAVRQTCLPVPPPAASGGELVAVYQPCGDTDTVARVDRWLPDRSLLTTVRAVFDCPVLAERDGGRRCAFDGPADGLVTAAEIDGATARVTLNNAVDGLSGALRNPGGLLAAIEATVFASYDTVERIELSIDTSDDPDTLCRMITLPGGCAERTRAVWADRPDGWRMASVSPPDALGTFGGQRPTGPLRVGGIVVRSGGHRSNLVRAVSARDGAPRWRHRVDGEDAFVADQALRDGVLVASTFGPVAALDAASGDRRWTHQVDPDQAPGAPAVNGDAVHVPASFGIEGDTRAPTVTALGATGGQVRWRTPLLPDTELQWAPPTVSDGRVIVADTPGESRGRSHLHALDAGDGERVWTFEFDSRRQGFHSEQPLVHADVVFAVNGGVLYALDLRTGDERWRNRDGTVTRVFGVAPDGIVVEVDARVEVLDIVTGTVAP